MKNLILLLIILFGFFDSHAMRRSGAFWNLDAVKELWETSEQNPDSKEIIVQAVIMANKKIFFNTVPLQSNNEIEKNSNDFMATDEKH